jgi:hypothetical protein
LARQRISKTARANRAVPFAQGGHQRWSVIWVTSRDGDYEIFRHECGNDLDEAIRVYTLVLNSSKRRLATLRSDNVGYPPPDKWHPHVVYKKKGKFRKPVKVDPMKKWNRKGWWWCPYCRHLRRFQYQSGFYLFGRYIAEDGYYCPLCGISHRDMHVRRWNPLGSRIYLEN